MTILSNDMFMSQSHFIPLSNTRTTNSDTARLTFKFFIMSFLVTGVRFPLIPPGLEKLLTPLDPGDSVVRAEKFSRLSIFFDF